MARPCTTEEKFLSNIDFKDRDTCWNWVGTKTERGYGRASFNNKRIQAHRHIYQLLTGWILPNYLVVRHSCDNRACCNPYHLSVGTVKDNIQDRVDRNRSYSPIGEKNVQHKLKENEVRRIKWNIDGEDAKYWANVYSVSLLTIKRIWLNQTWKHI